MTDRVKKKNKFWIIYATVTAVLVMAVAGLLLFLWDYLDDFEESRPAAVAGRVTQMIEVRDAESLRGVLAAADGAQMSEFDRAADISECVGQLAGEGKIGYAEKRGVFTSDAPVYSILSDRKEIAVLSLKKISDGSNRFGKWIPSLELGIDSVGIVAPSDAAVSINSVAVGDEYVTARDIKAEELDWLPEGVTHPTMVEYTIGGVHFINDVTAVTAQGVQADAEPVKTDIPGRRAYRVKHGGNDATRAEADALVKKVSTVYSNYVSIDAVFGDLAVYLIPGSQLYSRIKTLPNYFYAKHDSWDIRSFETSDYIYYSPDCFSMTVKYDYVILRGKREDIIKTNMTLGMVRIGSEWFLGDIRFNLTD